MPWLDPACPHLEDGGVFPVEYLERSPSLRWNDPGPHVKSFAVLLEDLDVEPVRVHWCVFDLPETARALPGGVGRAREVEGGKHATNDLGLLGYSGPVEAPAPGSRFALRVYALTRTLGFPAGVPAEEVVRALSGTVQQLASLVVRFEGGPRQTLPRAELKRRAAYEVARLLRGA
jgi:Raf kinase inhibitor-like YbhB/YbcL family protein